MKADREPFFCNEDFDDIIFRMLKAILEKGLLVCSVVDKEGNVNSDGA